MQQSFFSMMLLFPVIVAGAAEGYDASSMSPRLHISPYRLMCASPDDVSVYSEVRRNPGIHSVYHTTKSAHTFHVVARGLSLDQRDAIFATIEDISMVKPESLLARACVLSNVTSNEVSDEPIISIIEIKTEFIISKKASRSPRLSPSLLLGKTENIQKTVSFSGQNYKLLDLVSVARLAVLGTTDASDVEAFVAQDDNKKLIQDGLIDDFEHKLLEAKPNICALFFLVKDLSLSGSGSLSDSN